MHRVHLGQVGPAGAAAGLWGRSAVLSCGHWGPEDPLGSLSGTSPAAGGLQYNITITAGVLLCPKQRNQFLQRFPSERERAH